MSIYRVATCKDNNCDVCSINFNNVRDAILTMEYMFELMPDKHFIVSEYKQDSEGFQTVMQDITDKCS